MSIQHLPDGYTALRCVSGARYDAQNICLDGSIQIEWSWLSLGYVSVAKDLSRANGGSGEGGQRPTSWRPKAPPQSGPIIVWNSYENSPSRNSYYDWVNHTGYAFRLDAIRIQGSGPVGTNGSATGDNPNTNTVGIMPGHGISGAWEWSSMGTDAQIEDAKVEVRIAAATGSFTSLALVDNKLIDGATGPWVEESYFDGLYPQTPVQTPINKTFIPTLAAESRIVPINGRVRIQFYQDGGVTENPSAVLSDLTVQLTVTPV